MSTAFKSWLQRTFGRIDPNSHPNSNINSSSNFNSESLSTSDTSESVLENLPSPQPTAPVVRRPQHAARDARMSIPVNERKAHAEMLRRFEARRRGVEVSWPPQQQHQQQRSLETSIINFPQGDKPQRDETRSLVGKGKGKVDFPLIEDGDSGNAVATNRSFSSASASASVSASASFDDFAAYAYMGSRVSKGSWDAGEASSGRFSKGSMVEASSMSSAPSEEAKKAEE